MKKIFILLFSIVAISATAQKSWTPINGHQRFVSGLGIPVRDTSTAGPQDSAQMVIRPSDGLLWYKYKNAWTSPAGSGGGSMVYPGAGIAVSTGSAWGTSITDNSTNWNTAYTNRITSLTTTGSSGAATLASNTLNIPNYTLAGLGGQPLNTNLTSIAALANAAGVLRNNGTGTFSYDNTVLTANQAITVTATGDATGTSTSSGTAPSIALTVGKINGVALSGLATGILKNTTTTGVPSIAVAGDFPTLNQNTTGTAANITATTNSTLTTLSALSLPYSQLTGAPTISGSNTGDVTLATNSGLGFTAGQTGLALGTPSSVTGSSTNSVTTTTHTHAVSGLTNSNLSGSAGITVANGGTGVATITGIVKGNGTAAMTAATSGTDYSAGTAALATGILKSTTTTGALSIAVAGDFPTLNQNTTGSAGSVANAATFNNSGTGAVSGTTYNGSAAQTISYNTLGASPLAGSSSLVTTGTITSGTWNAGAVTSSGAVTGSTIVKSGGTASQILAADGSVITAGSGITISAGTIQASGTAGVTTFAGGTTGLTPASATSGAITLGGTLAIANGGTNLTALPTTPAASTYAAWDANKNFTANNGINAYTTTATAAGTTTLTVASTYQQYFTGTTTQTVVLPVATTLVNGYQLDIVNNSTGVVTVQTSGAVTVQSLSSNTELIITCINTAGGTGTASWSWRYLPVQATNPGVTSITAGTTGLTPSTATSGAVTLGGTLNVGNGGTGLTTYTIGDIPYASAATTISKLADAATGNALISGGAGVAPSYGKIGLTTHVSGTLPIANGGTNSATALSGSSIMVSNGTGIVQGTAGTATTVLHGNAAGTPTYSAVSLTADVSGTLPIANGGTNVTSVTTTPAATAFAGWDANKNLSANNVLEGWASTATAGGTTTLTVGSAQAQLFTGTLTQTVVLPVVTTLVNGQTFYIFNQSTGSVAVQTSGLNTLVTLPTNTMAEVSVVNTAGGTGTASWLYDYASINSTSSSTTNALTMNNSGTGAASGTTFNGSAAQTISYNTIGAQPQLSGTGFVKASGTTISYDNSTYLTTTTAGTTYVPYTGATGAVNLGTNTLSSGAITTSGLFTSTLSSGVNLQLNKTTGAAISLVKSNATAQEWQIAGEDNFKIYDITGGATNPFQITKGTGAATFSSSVTTANAGVFIGTSATSLVGDGTSIYLKATGNTYLNTSANTYVSNSGALTVGSSVTATSASLTASTASTSTTTGALVVTGGVGVGGQLTSNGIFSGGSIATGGVTITSGGTISAISTITGSKFLGNSSTPTKVNGGATVIGSTGGVTVTGNDVAMRATISVSGTSPSSIGTAVTITFANAYSSAPVVVLQNEIGASSQRWDVANVTTTGFEIRPAQILTTGTYTVGVHVML